MTLRRFSLTAPLVLGLLLSSAQAATLPCPLAAKLDINTYLTLSLEQWSEADQDQGSAAYAECQAGQLTDTLGNSPQLRERIVKLRTLYRTLRELEGSLAYAMAGGGTMHSHAVPRSYPEIEGTLSSVAALVLSPVGGQTAGRFTLSLNASKKAFEDRIKALKVWKPKAAASTSAYDAKTFGADVTRYAQAGAELMKLLGNKNDAATAAAYLPLQSPIFLGEYLREF
ncbi:hypothetical protein EHF33_07700 [Deinococcus psychrotolerans]|uniref:Imelysin-like domain-containing protein n=1 Tax=Deinococcus psychrotolerans TaxID=2489213 RepID=A0A3G8YES1_9DEIO|nr:hypothetical protein [Deinococcus psychrotolerans]AZI42647.1 hypothetical protein EHF33_07700 [Deinococcus psychrotolerans]